MKRGICGLTKFDLGILMFENEDLSSLNINELSEYRKYITQCFWNYYYLFDNIFIYILRYLFKVSI